MVDQLPYVRVVTAIVRRARDPLTLEEVQAQVEAVRAIDSRNPRQTVRNALSNVRLIETLGGRPARYTWWPRHLAESSLRQPLTEADLEFGMLSLREHTWLALWPDFYSGGASRSPGDVTLELRGAVEMRTRVSHLVEGAAVWGLPPSPILSDWYREQEASPGDDLIVRVLDVEERRYALELQRRSVGGRSALEAAIAERNQALAEAAYPIVRAGRPFVTSFELIPRLIAHEAFRHPLPPDPWQEVLRADLRFVVGPYSVILAQKIVDEIESELSAPADAFAFPRPQGSRNRARSEDVRQAWGRYLFDQGMEWRWAGYDREAEAYYKETLRLDPGHADAWVHVGNIRLDEGHVREALPLYERAEAAALERTIGDPDQYPMPYWGDLDSRPFMRALHGQGLCFYRLGRTQEARQVFERMLELNPNDNQGARFLLHDLKEGLTWEQSVKREEERFP